jgi:hypothetical protein
MIINSTDTIYARALAANDAGSPRAFVAINKCKMPQHSTPNENKTVKVKCRVDILAENNSSTEGINLGNFFCTHWYNLPFCRKEWKIKYAAASIKKRMIRLCPVWRMFLALKNE